MQEFFRNVSLYPRYLIAFALGIFFNAVKPLVPLLKKPSTAIALIGAAVSAFAFLAFTLKAMLGMG